MTDPIRQVIAQLEIAQQAFGHEDAGATYGQNLDALACRQHAALLRSAIAALAAGPRPQAAQVSERGWTATRDELGQVLCCHGRPITCAECGEEYANDLATPPTPPAPPAVIPHEDRNEQTRSVVPTSVSEVRPVLLPDRDLRPSVQAEQEEGSEGVASIQGLEAPAVSREAPQDEDKVKTLASMRGLGLKDRALHAETQLAALRSALADVIAEMEKYAASERAIVGEIPQAVAQAVEAYAATLQRLWGCE